MKDSELLVLFDFDTLLYNKKSWIIVNPLIGRVGSSIDLIQVLNFYKENRNKKGFSLFEHCIPDTGEISSISIEKAHKENINVLPLEKVYEAILNHKIRGRKVQFITLIRETKVLELIYNLFPEENRFLLQQISWEEYWEDIHSTIQSYSYPQMAKFMFIKKLLKKHSYNQDDHTEQILISQYKRIFYYTTDIAILDLLKQHLLEHNNTYQYSSHPIISYLIAHLIRY